MSAYCVITITISNHYECEWPHVADISNFIWKLAHAHLDFTRDISLVFIIKTDALLKCQSQAAGSSVKYKALRKFR